MAITKRGDAWQSRVWDAAEGKRITKTFTTRKLAAAFEAETKHKLATGTLVRATPTTVREAYERWIEDVESGAAKSRTGGTYKPGVIYTYRNLWSGRLLEALGDRKVAELRRRDVQDYVRALSRDKEAGGEGLAASTVRNLFMALRVVLNYAVDDDLIAVNPCVGVKLPSGERERDRIVAPAEAKRLLGLLADVQDRAIYATAFYAGLRRGELMALTWEHVSLGAHVLEVDRHRGNFDPRSGRFVAPKSKKGARKVPIPAVLVPYLEAQRDARAPAGEYYGRPLYASSLVFTGADGTSPFGDRGLADRAREAWGASYLGLHEARHTFASIAIAAGVNLKAISEAMGHASIVITADRYGHLMPDALEETRSQLDAYLGAA